MIGTLDRAMALGGAAVAALLLTPGKTLTVQSDGSLAGRVVDVKAGESSFRRPDTIPAGLTTFRLLAAHSASYESGHHGALTRRPVTRSTLPLATPRHRVGVAEVLDSDVPPPQ